MYFDTLPNVNVESVIAVYEDKEIYFSNSSAKYAWRVPKLYRRLKTLSQPKLVSIQL
jgi:hypothetical protein